jgi:hypothetical protein
MADQAQSMPPSPTIIPPPPMRVGPASTSGVVIQYGELQHAAIYLGMTRVLRGYGIGNIIFGVILCVLSVAFLLQPDHAFSLLGGLFCGIIGLAFIGEGVWLIAAPSAAGLLVAAITMFVSAVIFLLYNVVVLVVLIIAGVSLITRYKKYGPLMTTRPSAAMLKEAGALLDQIQKGKRKNTANLIEFSSVSAFRRRLWRGLLLDNMAVLIGYDGRSFGRTIVDIYFLPPSGFKIDVSRREVVGRWLKAKLFVSDLQMSGTMPPECYDRYQSWKDKYLGDIGDIAS